MFETSTWSKVWEEQLSTSCLDVEFSPDGRQIVFLAPYRGVLNLWVQELEEGSKPRLLTNSTNRPTRLASLSFGYMS